MLYFYLAMLETPEDKQKMTELYTTYREYLLRVALNILHSQDDAEDVLHQAFLRLAQDFTKIGQVDCHKTRNFLVIIVRGLSLNLYNDRRKVVEVSFDEVGQAEHPDMPEDQILKQYDADALRLQLECLPVRYRDVLYLTYYEELSSREIAQLINLSESGVRKLQERARHSLQKILRKEEMAANEKERPQEQSATKTSFI